MIEACDFEFVAIFAHECGAKPSARAEITFSFGYEEQLAAMFPASRVTSSAFSQYLPARSSNGCHQDGLSMYH